MKKSIHIALVLAMLAATATPLSALAHKKPQPQCTLHPTAPPCR